MARKPVLTGGKREEIAGAALELFFESGYDGTSVRSIMNRAGGEVGLFYYYFKNKDDVFDAVLDLFFARYDTDFAEIVAHGRRNPCRAMQDFFEYMERETEIFREKYADKMHRTVRWAIREHTLTLIEPYLERIVEIQSKYYGVRPALAIDVAAMYLTHGVGSCILHEDREKYRFHRAEIKKGTSLIMGMPAAEQELRTPCPAEDADVPGILALAKMVGDGIPNFEKAPFSERLTGYVQRGEAWVFHVDGQIVAALLYAKEKGKGTLDFLAVLPDFRRCGLAARLVETVAAQFPVGTELSVTICRESDPLNEVARMFYKALGFVEGELAEAFGCPCRRLTLTVPDGTPVRKISRKSKVRNGCRPE